MALTLLPSMVSSIPWELNTAEMIENLAWSLTGEEESNIEEGQEDDHLLAKTIQLLRSEGKRILHSSRAHRLNRAVNSEVNSPPPKQDLLS